ncbi:MAG: CRISPR system precrRNA processing endoribonuclease RAMP protein Cas6 [Candidatus Scalinduaceae bacterium]
MDEKQKKEYQTVILMVFLHDIKNSASQKQRVTMGGFIGKAVFEGDIEGFMTLIALGEYVHVGKGTSFGLGKYVIRGT